MRKLLRCLASLRFPWLLLASTPAFASDGSTFETAASHLEKNTNVYLILLAAAGPILALVGAALFTVKYLIPIWQTEQKATRDQRESEGEKTRQHIAEDRESARLLADEQHKRLVDSISGRVERLHDDVQKIATDVSGRFDAMHGIVKAIALKTGAGALAILLACGAIAVACRVGRTSNQIAGREKCDRACAAGKYCCGKAASGADSDGCCGKARETATKGDDRKASLLGPRSDVYVVSIYGYAYGCVSSTEVCQ